MGIPILILGESGSGKSTSMRNFKENEVCIFNVAGKPLPFKQKLYSPKNTTNIRTYDFIVAWMNRLKDRCKIFVIDDAQYLMAFEMFEKAKETGYGKFTDCALNFYNLVQFVIKSMPDDTTVYFLQHTETTDTGKIKAKTSGKMIDSQLTLEGLFSIVLLTLADGDRHFFKTQGEGVSTAKSPMGMFEREIENDLKLVDRTIREYWNLADSQEQLKQNEKEEEHENA